MNLYVKMFLVTAIPFALLVVLALGIALGFREAAVPGLMAGLAFGLLMTAILGTLDWWCTRKSATGGTRGPKQTVTLEMAPPTAEVFDRCERALTEIGAEIEILQRDRNFLEATTDYTWRSWGEVIQIHISDQDSEKIQVRISSAPQLKTTLVDYGKGRANVRKIAELLTGGGGR